MHDDEPDTFEPQTWPERVCAMLAEIGVDASPAAGGGAGPRELFSRYFSSTPRMVTDRGTLEVRGANIDAVQVVQRG